MSSATNYRGQRFIGLAVAFSLLVAACGKPQQQAGGPGAVPVQLQALQPGTFEDSSEFVGSLQAEQRVDLKPEIDGRITQILVSAGDSVAPGQPIVQLSADQAQAQVSGSRAGAEAALYGRNTAQAQLEAANAQLAQTKADLSLAEANFRRTKSLVEDGALSVQELDNARNQLEVSRAAQSQAEENVRAAQSQLRQAASSLNQAQAQVEVNQATLGFKQVTAPIAGLVGDIQFKVGDYVALGQTITTITYNRNLFLRIQVPATRSTQLQVGLPVELLDPNSGDRVSTGSISFISPEVDSNAQAILVKARFPNDAGTLREGQFVRARLIWNTVSTLLVPTVAVSRVGGQSFVFVADEQTNDSGQTMQVASQRPVQLGAIQGDSYQVLSGLKAGENIVVTNILKLQDGVPIQTETEASANSPGG